MADDATQNQDGQDSTDTTSGGGDGSKPDQIVMTSAQLKERLERAKPADYDDLVKKAARLDEIEAANKSELEKATDALAAAKAERDKAVADALRFKVAAAHGISGEDAAMFLTGTDEETLTAQATKLAALTKPSGLAPVIPQLGGKTTATGSSADQFAEFAQQFFQ